MFKLYFLAGVITKEEVEKYRDTIEQLINGEWRGLSFEKLRGYTHVYSVRDSGKGRLLISFPMINGERSLLILEALPNHEYAKSRVLRSGIIRQHITDFKMKVDEYPFDSLENTDEVKKLLPQVALSSSFSSSSTSIASFEVKPLHYYFSSYIEHSAEQESAIALQAPQLVTGPSGSGKSCVAVAKARSLYNALSRLGSTGTITYIAPTKALCKQVKASFKATLPQEADNSVVVKFLTYQEWISLSAGISVIGLDEFTKWVANFQLRSCNQIKDLVGAKNKNRLTHINKIYTEMQLIVVHAEQEYLELGIRESLYEKEGIRKELIELTKHYVTHLKTKNLCDIALNPEDFFQSNAKTEEVNYVLVDEAQSIPPAVLKLLITHYGQSSYFFADSNQNTEMQLSVLPLLKKWLSSKFKENVSLNTNRLEVCYRCPEAITAAANWVLKLKQHIAQGISDKSETVKVVSVSGEVKGCVGIVKAELKEIEALNQRFTKEQLRCAVIAPKELIEQAKQAFPDILVFTVQEIRGLQFDHIIAYRLFSTKEMQALNDKLRELKKGGFVFDPTAESYKHLPKKDGESETRFNPELNGLFIAFTRAMKSLWIVESYDQHRYEFTAQSLYGYLNPSSQSSHQAESSSSSSTLEAKAVEVAETAQNEFEYLELLKQLLVNGNESQAKDLFLRKHRGDAQDFERLKQYLNLSEGSSSSHAVQEETSSSSSSSSSNSISESSSSEERPSRKPRRTKKSSSLVATSSNTSQQSVKSVAVRLSALYNLSLTKQGGKKLLNEYQNNIEKLDINELCAIHSAHKVPALYWLATYPEGCTLLGKLSDEQISKISTEALCAIHPVHKVPALYWLAANPEGDAWLGKLSEEQISKISIKALCAIHPDDKVPALYWLAATPEGRPLLGKLSDEQISKISTEALCAIHPVEKVPALYWLAQSDAGLALLAKLSDKQLKQLDPQSFYSVYSNQTSEYCAFDKLIKTEKGLEIFKRFVECNAKFLEHLTNDYLAQIGQADSQETRREILEKTEIGREILKKIQMQNSPHTTFFSTSSHQEESHQQTQSSASKDLEVVEYDINKNHRL